MYIFWSLALLVICTIEDIRERKVFSNVCLINMISALFIRIVLKNVEWQNVMLDLIPGGIILLIGFITKETIGKGDGILIITLGSILGMKMCMELLFWAFFICTFVSAIGLLWGKIELKSRVPFVPFLLLGEVVSIIL